MARTWPKGAVQTDHREIFEVAKVKNMTKIAMAVVTVLAASSAWASTAPVPVPEPGSLGLLAAGIAGVVAVVRARRRK
jgi:hypothetical protein